MPDLTACHYFVIRDEPGTPLIIEDSCQPGRRSVTNDAEAVVAQLIAAGKLPAGRRLFYVDSSGSRDEIVVRDGQFAGFRPGWEVQPPEEPEPPPPTDSETRAQLAQYRAWLSEAAHLIHCLDYYEVHTEWYKQASEQAARWMAAVVVDEHIPAWHAPEVPPHD